MKRFILTFSVFLGVWISFCNGQSNCVDGRDTPIDNKWRVTSVIVEPFLVEGEASTAAPPPSKTTVAPSSGNSNSSDTENSTDVTTTDSAPAAPPSDNASSGNSTNDSPSNTGGASSGKYSGYVVDLLDKLAEALGITYEISLVPDNRYGKQEGDKWNGLIGEICDGKADIAAAPITVTVNREEAIDFTYSILDIKAVAVIKKRESNLKIDSLQALLNNSYQLGINKESPVLKLIAESKNELVKKAFENINRGLVDDNEQGFEKVRKEDNFAYIVEDTVANYVLKQPPCGLEAIQTNLYQRKYAFAVAQGSTLRDQINKVIVDWQIDGTLTDLQTKWWGADQCSGCSKVSQISVFLSLVFAAFSLLYSRIL